MGFRSGADVREHSDDRALVDGKVTPRTVMISATTCLAIGLSSGLGLALRRGEVLASIVIIASILCFVYTADPFSLKGVGLGDLVIFLMFGPLLMAGVALAVIGSIPAVILPYSLPIGLQTTAVLHANNTRDITTDRAAGTFTWAMRLGEDMAYRWHCFLFFTSYAAAFALGFAETPVPNLR